MHRLEKAQAWVMIGTSVVAAIVGIATVIGLSVQVLALQEEQAIRKAEREEARSAQQKAYASRVTWWIRTTEEPDTLVFQNGSPVAVTGVWMSFEPMADHDGPWELQLIDVVPPCTRIVLPNIDRQNLPASNIIGIGFTDPYGTWILDTNQRPGTSVTGNGYFINLHTEVEPVEGCTASA